MNCLAPISIPDKVAARYGYHGRYIKVPCGHCAQCARDRRNDWYVRLNSVYRRHVERHIPVWFVTVTINQNLWPGYLVSSPGVEDRVTGFVRSWCERFRYLNDGKMPLRFLCCEFGSENRPYIDDYGNTRISTGALHFHGFIFGFINWSKVAKGLEETHGWVDYSRVRGPQCIRYTVKYATKDFSEENPKRRSRVFCSPGLGDPSFYFGESIPTPVILIGAFHYRTPRYLIEKQWIWLYSKSHFDDWRSRISLRNSRLALTDVFGRFFLVNENAKKRILLYNQQDAFYASNRDKLYDPNLSVRSYWLEKLLQSLNVSSFDDVKTLYNLGLTGLSHPLFRREYLQNMYYHIHDDILPNEQFFNFNPYLFFTDYERYKNFFSLSGDFET
ncbi:replication initiator protein [Microvirus mar48]|uniref:Replication initiator protein n=1 Tax=Microvirus mar48 TaxID=2851183 RepID=A0A8F5RC38_9VIRU|nr:replication initiator protein [Microvirus mar48]